MNENEKMFQIGLWMFGIMCLVVIGLQVCYRTQNRARNRVHAEIVQTQQDIAVAQANFATIIRPEVLRNSVLAVSPKAEVVSFHKSVSINEIPPRPIKE